MIQWPHLVGRGVSAKQDCAYSGPCSPPSNLLPLRANPYGEHYLDGVSLNLFEVMFVKVKGRLLDNGWSFAQQAAKYTEIMRQQKVGFGLGSALVGAGM